MIKTIKCKEYYVLSLKELQEKLGIKERILRIETNKNKKIRIQVLVWK